MPSVPRPRLLARGDRTGSRRSGSSLWATSSRRRNKKGNSSDGVLGVSSFSALLLGFVSFFSLPRNKCSFLGFLGKRIDRPFELGSFSVNVLFR